MTKSNQQELLEDWPRQCTNSEDDRRRAAAKAARRDTLQDRQESKSSLTFACCGSEEDADEHASASTATTTKSTVRFSETSKLYLCEREPFPLLHSLTYTKTDQDRFGTEAMFEGHQIKSLIEQVPFDSVPKSIKYLLHHDVISIDELVGIEHFIFGEPTGVRMIRRRHAAAVLRKQQQLEEQLQHHQTTDQKLEDAVLSLGKFARSMSARSKQSANIRAQVAASKDVR